MIFGGLRATALANDLWLDELWTLWHVSQLQSVGEIFSRFIHDNNHPLNTLWMYALAPLKTDWAYRLLSWLGGTAGVWLAARVAGVQWVRVQPDASAAQLRTVEWIAAVLFGSSYLLIVYSSEARGYGPALGLGLLGMYALFRGARVRPGAWAVVYWASLILGVLAHAISYQLIAAGVVFTVVQSFSTKTNGPDTARALIRWHAIPLAFGMLYYVTFIRRLEVVGGPETPLSSVLGEWAAFSTGLPKATGVTLALPLLTAGVVIALIILWRRSPALACYHVVAMIALPAAAVTSSRFVYLFPRYFILSAASALLLVGYVAAHAWHQGRVARGIVIVVLGAVVAGNLVHMAQLLRHGRGGYKAALRHIAANTPPGDITVGSDHDGRNVLLVHHHGPEASRPRTIDYIPSAAFPAHGVQWLLVHRLDHAPVPDSEVVDARGNLYRLEKIFLHAPPSGWDWYLYRSRRLLP